MIWSEESFIILEWKSRRRRCIQKKDQVFLSRYYNQIVKSGKIIMMIWACFTNKESNSLIVCDAGSVNADHYLQILKNDIIMFIDALLKPVSEANSIIIIINDNFLFMHDNMSYHTIIKVITFLKKWHLSMIKWSTQSLDLNSIENIWSRLKWAINNREELIKVIREEWKHIVVENFNDMISSMPERMAACIAAKGGYTKW